MRDVADALVDRDPDVALVRWIEATDAVEVETALPARDLLPEPSRYAHLEVDGESLTVGYVEASRGCSHRCRHCPVPVVFDGRIRIMEVDAVVADVAQQVAAGARHITFGDPDFFNGVHHARRVVQAVHTAFPDLTFDCTVKVEHILRFEDAWSELAASGCLFVISAFESVNDATLTLLDKGHTASDGARAVELLREHGIEPRPTWLPFTPWATLADVQDIAEFVAAHDLIGNVDPVQYTVRLLLPAGSLLLGHIDGHRRVRRGAPQLHLDVIARPAAGSTRRARGERAGSGRPGALQRDPRRPRSRAPRPARHHAGRAPHGAVVLLLRADRHPARRALNL